jgi:RNA polymerase sigma-70 factor (ECF subfamily)
LLTERFRPVTDSASAGWRAPATDESLVEAANRGDPRAFEALYYRYRDWVVRLAYRFTGNEADALDVLQDTFTYLLRKLPRLRLSARMTTFLYPVVKNLSLAVIRKKKPLTLQDEALAEVPTRAGDPLTAGADRDELGRVLAVLPAAQREVLLMRVVDDMSLADIAQALAVPLGTVKSRLHTALKTLRQDPRTRSYFLE